jgi:hypothetical protein
MASFNPAGASHTSRAGFFLVVSPFFTRAQEALVIAHLLKIFLKTAR